jgi:hypothetical protein
MTTHRKRQKERSWPWICAILAIFLLFFVFIGLIVAGRLGYNRTTAVIPENPAGIYRESTIKYYPPTLKSLIVNPDSPNNYFDFLLETGDEQFDNEAQLKPKTEDLIKYFFMGITLPPNEFWVNLNPLQSSKIISPRLGRTDMGRVLLEADLRLKRDTASLTDPRMALGKEYWQKLNQKLQEQGLSPAQVPGSTRVWIVPGSATVQEEGDIVTIVDSKLKVCLESEYLSQMDHLDSSNNVIASQAFKEVILPELEYKVNYGRAYAPLRQVYNSLILAKCYKQKHWGKGSFYSHCVHQGYLTGLHSEEDWDKKDFFNDYLRSHKQGEYSFYQQEYDPNFFDLVSRHYFSGGVDIGLSELEINYIGSSRQDNPIASSPMRYGENDEKAWKQFIGGLDRIPRGLLPGTPYIGEIISKLRYITVSEITLLGQTGFLGIHRDCDQVLAVKINIQFNERKLDFGIGFLIFKNKADEPVAFAINSALFNQASNLSEANDIFVLAPFTDLSTKNLLGKISERIESKAIDLHPAWKITNPLEGHLFDLDEKQYKIFTSYLREQDRNKLYDLFKTNIYFKHLIKYFVKNAGINFACGNILRFEELNDDNKHYGGHQVTQDHAYGKDFGMDFDARLAFGRAAGGDGRIDDQAFVHEVVHAIFRSWLQNPGRLGFFASIEDPRKEKLYKTHKNIFAAYNYLKNKKKFLETGKRSASDEDVNYPSVHLINETLAYLYDSAYFWLSNPDATQPSRITRLSREDIIADKGAGFLRMLDLLPNETVSESNLSSPVRRDGANTVLAKFTGKPTVQAPWEGKVGIEFLKTKETGPGAEKSLFVPGITPRGPVSSPARNVTSVPHDWDFVHPDSILEIERIGAFDLTDRIFEGSAVKAVVAKRLEEARKYAVPVETLPLQPNIKRAFSFVNSRLNRTLAPEVLFVYETNRKEIDSLFINKFKLSINGKAIEMSPPTPRRFLSFSQRSAGDSMAFPLHNLVVIFVEKNEMFFPEWLEALLVHELGHLSGRTIVTVEKTSNKKLKCRLTQVGLATLDTKEGLLLEEGYCSAMLLDYLEEYSTEEYSQYLDGLFAQSNFSDVTTIFKGADNFRKDDIKRLYYLKNGELVTTPDHIFALLLNYTNKRSNLLEKIYKARVGKLPYLLLQEELKRIFDTDNAVRFNKIEYSSKGANELIDIFLKNRFVPFPVRDEADTDFGGIDFRKIGPKSKSSSPVEDNNEGQLTKAGSELVKITPKYSVRILGEKNGTKQIVAPASMAVYQGNAYVLDGTKGLCVINITDNQLVKPEISTEFFSWAIKSLNLSDIKGIGILKDSSDIVIVTENALYFFDKTGRLFKRLINEEAIEDYYISADIYVLDSSQNKIKIYGEEDENPYLPGSIMRIYQEEKIVFIASNSEGNIYTAYASGKIERYNNKGMFDRNWTIEKAGNCISDIDVDKEGSIYVLDTEKGVILKFDKRGNPVEVIGKDILQEPIEIKVVDGKIFVLDIVQNNILIFERDQAILSSPIVTQLPVSELGGIDLGATVSSPTKTISEVEPIDKKQAIFIREKADLKEIVEEPLLEACEIFYDKNIQTESTSANKEDFSRGNNAHIVLNYDTLSDENKEIALKYGKVNEYGQWEKWQGVQILIPIDAKTTDKEVSKRAIEIANAFKKQKMSWVPVTTIDELRTSLDSPEVTLEELLKDDFISDNYYYDPVTQLFYLNKEHWQKANEPIEGSVSSPAQVVTLHPEFGTRISKNAYLIDKKIFWLLDISTNFFGVSPETPNLSLEQVKGLYSKWENQKGYRTKALVIEDTTIFNSKNKGFVLLIDKILERWGEEQPFGLWFQTHKELLNEQLSTIFQNKNIIMDRSLTSDIDLMRYYLAHEFFHKGLNEKLASDKKLILKQAYSAIIDNPDTLISIENWLGEWYNKQSIKKEEFWDEFFANYFYSSGGGFRLLSNGEVKWVATPDVSYMEEINSMRQKLITRYPFLTEVNAYALEQANKTIADMQELSVIKSVKDTGPGAEKSLFVPGITPRGPVSSPAQKEQLVDREDIWKEKLQKAFQDGKKDYVKKLNTHLARIKMANLLEVERELPPKETARMIATLPGESEAKILAFVEIEFKDKSGFIDKAKCILCLNQKDMEVEKIYIPTGKQFYLALDEGIIEKELLDTAKKLKRYFLENYTPSGYISEKGSVITSYPRTPGIPLFAFGYNHNNQQAIMRMIEGNKLLQHLISAKYASDALLGGDIILLDKTPFIGGKAFKKEEFAIDDYQDGRIYARPSVLYEVATNGRKEELSFSIVGGIGFSFDMLDYFMHELAHEILENMKEKEPGNYQKAIEVLTKLYPNYKEKLYGDKEHELFSRVMESLFYFKGKEVRVPPLDRIDEPVYKEAVEVLIQVNLVPSDIFDPSYFAARGPVSSPAQDKPDTALGGIDLEEMEIKVLK